MIKTYLVRVFAANDKGDRRRVGAAEIYTTSRKIARTEAIEELWDPDLYHKKFFPEVEITDITNQK